MSKLARFVRRDWEVYIVNRLVAYNFNVYE
jgi:hypothetical protein